MTETKYIPISKLKVGMEIKGYKTGNTTSFCTQEVVAIKNNTVKLSWGTTLENASDYMFSVKLTDKELREKYKAVVQEIREALNHDLGQVDGYHEMWNSWLYASNLTEMASTLNEHKMRIIGYATLTVPKHAMFSDEVLDIGIVAEYEDGERIWCHASDKYRKSLLNRDKREEME